MKEATVDPLDLEDPSIMDRIQTFLVEGHYHPNGTALNNKGEMVEFTQEISGPDRDWARDHPVFAIYFVVAVDLDKTVFFYNNKGKDIGHVTWDYFINGARKK